MRQFRGIDQPNDPYPTAGGHCWSDHSGGGPLNKWGDPWADATPGHDPTYACAVAYDIPASALPEPASCALLVPAVGGIGAMLRKRREA